MNYSSIPSAQSVVFHCKAQGIKNIIISPGSRNAPLTIGFTEDPFFRCFSIVDERSAAFFALGIAQQKQEAVAVVCTSGSALLNYYPAVAEAFYSDIPLVVISADRPSNKIDIGDGQTIRQDNIFERHIGYSANLKLDIVHAINSKVIKDKEAFKSSKTVEDEQKTIQAFNDVELNKALRLALLDKTPIHINVPFEEPLYDVLENPSVTQFVDVLAKKNDLKINSFQDFANIWNTSKRKMILVGVNYPNTVEQKLLDILATDESVIVLTETTSNVHHPNFFPSIDSIIAPIEKSKDNDKLFKALQPDVLLTFGGLIVSKKIKSFLRVYRPQHHWHVDDKKAYDTFYCLSHHFRIGPNSFFIDFLEHTRKIESGYYEYWKSVKHNYQKKREQYISDIPFTDMSVFHHIVRSIPNNWQLQLANSSTVRYAQLFDLDPSLNVFCNRGTSGIDGSTSTAIGAAIYCEAPTILITGDLSFFYDSNGLWNNYIRPDFRIILINNGGGGIFRILPGKEDTENFETFFETAHDLKAEHLCKMHNIEFIHVTDEISLKSSLRGFYKKSNSPKLLEIDTPRLLNNKILLNYFDFIS